MKSWIVFLLFLASFYNVYSDYPSVDDAEFGEFEDFEADDVVVTDKRSEWAEIEEPEQVQHNTNDENEFVEADDGDGIVQVRQILNNPRGSFIY